tara:strand:- start:324 stop:602 length:279 start_codon:yes stop_codon:yes gene_type:complete
MTPFALNYAGLWGAIELDTFMNYLDVRQSNNATCAGGMDIASTDPMQLFTYMLRLMFFEAWSLFTLSASIDNLILLYLCVAGIRIPLVREKR